MVEFLIHPTNVKSYELSLRRTRQNNNGYILITKQHSVQVYSNYTNRAVLFRSCLICALILSNTIFINGEKSAAQSPQFATIFKYVNR